jgi:TonB family protein
MPSSVRLFRPVLFTTLLLCAMRALAGAPLPVLLAQVDESLFRDAQKIRPNWWRESQDDDRTSLSHFTAWISAAVQHVQYPSYARRHNQQGTVLVAVLFDTDGSPPAIEIAQSSGFKVLDLEALRAVRAIEPASLPPEFRDRPVNAVVPIVFRLEYDETPPAPAAPR